MEKFSFQIQTVLRFLGYLFPREVFEKKTVSSVVENVNIWVEKLKKIMELSINKTKFLFGKTR